VDKSCTNHTLHLGCSKEYEVAVTSLSAANANTDSSESSFSDSRIWNFTVRRGVPLPPTIQKEKTKTLSCDVNLTWSTPADNGCPLTKYLVYFKLSYEDKQHIYMQDISDLKENAFILMLKCNSRYMIEVSAWNELGESNRSKTLEITTNSG
ncbi:unnamed protein product, partial [Porites evermanni]